MADIQKLQTITSQVRRDIVRMVNAVNSGHPGGSLGCTEFFVAFRRGVWRCLNVVGLGGWVRYCAWTRVYVRLQLRHKRRLTCLHKGMAGRRR